MPAGPASSSSFLLIIAIVCITIGYVFGWIISSNQRARVDKNKTPVPETEPDSPAVAESLAEPIQEAVEAPPPISGLSPLLRVWSTGAEAGLVVDLGSKTINDPARLTLDDRMQIESGLRATANWMGLTYQLGEPVQTVNTLPPLQPVIAEPSLVMSEPMDLTRQPAVISGMTNALADALQPAVKKDTTLSIVQQIDEVFQGMLMGTPYEGKKIFLTEDPRRGVMVRVENDVYEGVGAVPEGDIKKLLRSAVAEWERRQEINRRRQTA